MISGLLLRRRVLDADTLFVASNGLSKTAFKRKYGTERLRVKELESTKALLTKYDEDCVIACGSSIAAEQLQEFMAEYRQTHLVIYVNRSVDDIEEYLGLKERGKLGQWMNGVRENYQGITNFEFFNLLETCNDDKRQCQALERLQSVLSHRLASQRKVQALQGTKTALARFLAAALGHNASALSLDIFPTIYPPFLEERIYSNSMRISLVDLSADEIDVTHISTGADVVELVLDAQDPRCRAIMASGTVGRFVAEIRRFVAVPVIYNVDMPKKAAADWELYFSMLYEGLRLAPEYLTVDLHASSETIRDLIARRGCTTVIGDQDTTDAKSDFWLTSEPLELYRRAVELRCGVVRLTRPCLDVADNFSCLSFIERVKATPDSIPIIAYNTGFSGRISSVCNPTLTPVSSDEYSAVERGSVAPGTSTLSIRERWTSLFDLHILHPLKFFVVGAVKNSLSPAMHNAAFQTLGMPHVYSTHEAMSLEELRVLLHETDFGGASVTMPFKEAILALTQKLSPSAEIIGASNTILPTRRWKDDQLPSDARCKEHRHRAGPVAMLYGDNTDWIGISACLSRSISPANSINSETTGLVIGAGGMARAAVYCLLHLGVRNICIFNRTVSHAESMANHYEQVFPKFTQGNSQPNLKTTVDGQTDKLRIKVLDSLETPWPSNFRQPNIVICAIKAHDSRVPASTPITMPRAWMRSPTGGVVVEVKHLWFKCWDPTNSRI